MHETRGRTTNRRATSLGWLVLGALSGLLACISGLERRVSDAPPQGWWAERGPVVPHDSFPSDCSLCHGGEDWQTIRSDFEFDHAASTGVALEGAHAAAECLRCHNDRGPVAVFAQRGCAGCHEDVHRGQLGASCDSCHAEETWQPREEIVLHDRTRLPLVGAHAAVACWRCHDGAEVGSFRSVDTACESCHADDLARAREPDHVAFGFVNGCERCHVPVTWEGFDFDHTSFPLTGGHANVDCSACHANGYAGTPTDCFACHSDDYVTANDPNHTGGGFPTSCELCHTTQGWDGATFDHRPLFPLAGDHNRACEECHLVPQDYGQFSCTHCHAHSQSEAGSEHSDVGGYQWESHACLRCHPRGTD